jgi:hypothetical protein
MANDINIVIGAQDKASKVLDNVSSKVGSSTSMMSALGPAAVAAGAAVAGAAAAFFSLQAGISAVSSAANEIDALYDTAKGLGETVGDLQAFQFAMNEAGNVNAEQSVAALKKIQRAIGDIASGGDSAGLAVFEKLGLDAQALSMQGPVAQFTAVKKALSEIENSSERAAVAQQILGKSASDLMPALLAEQQGFEDSMRAAQELGLVVSGEGASAVAAMNDATGRLYAGFEGIANQVAVAVAPAIEAAATALTQWLPPIIDISQKYLPAIVDYIALAAGDMYDLGRAWIAFHTFDGKALRDALQFDTGAANLKTINEARQRAAADAQADADNALASVRTQLDMEREITSEIDKQSEARERERQKALEVSQGVIASLERQIAVMDIGETAVREMENLSKAANEEDRARIETLQKEIASRKEQEETKKQEQIDVKTDDPIAKALSPAGQLQAVESRLLTRGSSEGGPMEKIIQKLDTIMKWAIRTGTATETIADNSDSPGEKLTLEFTT